MMMTAMTMMMKKMRRTSCRKLQMIYFPNRGYAFQSFCFERSNIYFCGLNTVFRQTDKDFIAILNRIRKGEAMTEAEKSIADRIPRFYPTFLSKEDIR